MGGAFAEYPFGRCKVLLVVPPFAAIFQPSLACHLLQACARRREFDVSVVYGNLIFASMIGAGEYAKLAEQRLQLERIFQEAAFGRLAGEGDTPLKPELTKPRQMAAAWLDRMEGIIRSVAPKVVGCTCSFEQITSSVALLNRSKQADSGITTIIGGANCEAEMAEGIRSLGARIDVVASGESEESFPAFLEEVLRLGRQPERVIQGKPCMKLDALPTPEYGEYFEQYRFYLGGDSADPTRPAVPYESSRGCWWGEKHHCTFCGLNGTTMKFREKPADLVAREIAALPLRYPVTRINVVDNIMPHTYFSALLPRLKSLLPENVAVFYEQKANLSLQKMQALKDARVTSIQPGIESLNTHILECIDKGVTASQNLALLRFARSLGMDATWNLLAGFPGDRREDYEQLASLIPLISHLQPPDGLGFLRIDRFSPYFDHPERYGIRNLRPKPIYFEVFPPHTDFEKLAYYFDGDYQCGAFECREVLEAIAQQTGAWSKRWEYNPKPILSVVHLFEEQFLVTDTRGEGAPEFHLIGRAQAQVALTGAETRDRRDLQWAFDKRLLVELDGRLVPLATAPPALLVEFERTSRKNSLALVMS
jgi:ribosomal peptide maturation radical SAM protein 1